MLMVVGFVALLTMIVVSRLSADALGVIVGVALGLVALLPPMFLFAWMAGRRSAPRDHYAPPSRVLYAQRRPAARTLRPTADHHALPARRRAGPPAPAPYALPSRADASRQRAASWDEEGAWADAGHPLFGPLDEIDDIYWDDAELW